MIRARRQVWTIDTGNDGGQVDVVLGVNGYIWIAKHVASEVATSQAAINRLEETVSNSIYSSQNDEIGPKTRREIARIAGCIRALVEAGVRVDEEMVMRAYDASLEVDMEGAAGKDGEGEDYLGGERGRRVVEMAMAGLES